MTTVVVEESVMEPPPLTLAHERCDRCGAEAYIMTEHDGSILTWCAHHAHKYRDKLASHKVLDETARLNYTPV